MRKGESSMRLKEIYKADIDRDINGVIKVAQDDEDSIEQELREYIITRELCAHFRTFLDIYERSLSQPTDKIGVWISGFFGSGKSHFLKILSYLLSNRVIAGKHAVAYFSDKFDDPLMFAQLERCASVPTDAILFNIDSKSPLNKDKTAILRIFAKVFYEHMGFYGNDLKVAKLEQFILKSGKSEEFRQAFEAVNGDSWLNARDTLAFFEDDVVHCLTKVLGMSEAAARNWFNGTESADISIEQLVSEINAYVEARGEDYRLLFMIDEVGQYIGSDSDLMLNLQTIVEEIGTRCGGRVWVMVTSQEAIDSITKVSGDDFSKIQGRFNTRLSLSSSSVDEVIKKRILAKNTDAENLLRLSYSRNQAVLKNLFSFQDAVLDLKGYADADNFVETYPFVPYQFKLMQNVLVQIRKHGNSGKHLSGGERSMLSGFQEAAQAIEDRDENALVPFYLFYDTVHTFLEGAIRRVIDRCQTAADSRDGLEQQDVSVLKLLYLIRYVEDVKANPDTITTLMADRIDVDKLALREAVQVSLDRLLSQNYIARNGDTYAFLTDDEQDIAREIRNTPVDSANITQAIAQIVFGDLYAFKKFRYDRYDFPFDQMVDDMLWGTSTGAVKLRLVTASSEPDAGDSGFLMRSGSDNEAIVVLSDGLPYFEELESAMKIRKYVKGRNVAHLPESIQSIIRGRQQQAGAFEQRAKECIVQAIMNARFYAAGERIPAKGSNVKEKLDFVLSCLIESVYKKLNLIHSSVDSDTDIFQLLARDAQAEKRFAQPNAQALAEIEQYLKTQEALGLPTSMGDIQRRFQGIPYGWREIDIAALVAILAAGQRVTVSYSGSSVQPGDQRFPDYLRRRNDIVKTLVARRAAIPDGILKSSRELLREYLNVMDVPTDEDPLIAFVMEQFSIKRDEFAALLEHEYKTGCYPGREVATEGVRLCEEVLSQRKDGLALLNRMNELRDELLDQSEDMAEVTAFFKDQRPVFDSAAELYGTLSDEQDYLQDDAEAQSALATVAEILALVRPYRRISELPALLHLLRTKYAALLEDKKGNVLSELQAAIEELHQTAGPGQEKILKEADTVLEERRQTAAAAPTLTALDALRTRLEEVKRYYLQLLIGGEVTGVDIMTVSRTDICHTAALKDEADAEKYLAEVKKRLLDMLEGHDILHIV